MKRLAAGILVLTLGCSGYRGNLVRVADVDGSNDHRIFRIGSVTKIMMEPAIWQLEDSGRINLDRPVGDYFKDPLPPEFEKVTLRDLHDNRTGLPREFIDPWCLGDVYTAFKSGLVGSNIYADFDTREDFVAKLWSPRYRAMMRKNAPEYSNMGYVLLMMAITDHVGMTVEELCDRYLVKPYGLKDTSFSVGEGARQRLTPACAGHLPWLRLKGMEVHENRTGEVTKIAGGMLSSASDVLKVAYVLLPKLDRLHGLLREARLSDRRKVFYRSGMIYGGHAFLGFDPANHRAAVILRNETQWPDSEGLELLEQLSRFRPEDQ